jgi:hypothetical protein
VPPHLACSASRPPSGPEPVGSATEKSHPAGTSTRHHGPMPKAKVTVRLPNDLLVELRERAGTRGVSPYVNELLRCRLDEERRSAKRAGTPEAT